ncbi:type II inositol 1,4,5-trisphosphate 5-phosphatase [Patella vulgata]|uniref:type II inositol 1,4,5-trisphosphate 5-phosphatase n=1 Tax=Patella vulgata TaxID=6465 RepID=UPI0024A82FCC|nr:type II inositol 1,4,5-trisphosphate 5-phosphatase [Patella vulgata]
MFYEPLEETVTETVIDPTTIVQKKISKVDKRAKCVICVYCDLLVDWVKTPRYVALIQYQDDHAIFSFTSTRIPCFSTSDLAVEKIIPVDSSLKYKTETPSKNNLRKEFALSLKTGDDETLLKIPHKDSTRDFLSHLKRAKDLQSQIAGLVEPSEFLWLNSFQPRDMTSFPSTSSKRDTGKPGNPFQTDVFDPYKSTNRHSSPGMVASKSSGFEDSFNDVLKISKSNVSKSLESLDNLDSDFGESVDVLEQQLGISNMPVGNKPIAVREEFVRGYMKKREDEYTNLTPLKIFCGTWNVNGQSPTEPLTKWLCYDAEPPDIYAIGFQELDLSNQAYIFTDSTKDAEWQKAVRDFLHPKAKYRRVKSVRLVGVMLLVYIQEKYTDYVTLVDSDTVATGIMGFMGNKGGVSVRFKIHNTSLCFTNSHLAAHQDEFERRNQDYRDIESKTRFKQFAPFTIQENDLIFWIGDLNYRISNLNIDEVKLYSEQGLYGKLLPHDQLNSQLGRTDIFRGYQEGPITFQPTYKYDTGTNNWDSSEKSRMPAYCDRILYKGSGIRQLRYNSHQSLCVSDHKPVSALHECNIKVIDTKKHKKVYEEVMKKLDRIENEYLPQVKLSCTEYYFKDVKFIEPRSDKLIVSNIGQEPVTIEFIKKLDDPSISKPWLQVTPYRSIILPGDIVEIQLDIYVEKSTACKLNNGEDTLDDILVLHLHGGKDFFISFYKITRNIT